MTITTAQIRGARGILGWSQQDLAQRTGISATSIGAIENNQTTPRESTLTTIRKAFESGGIEFLAADGLRKKTIQVDVLAGPEGFQQLSIDIYATAQKDTREILQAYVDDKRFASLLAVEAVQHVKRVETIKGLKLKILQKEGDAYFPAKKYADYRWIPEKNFLSVPFYVYGDKLAVVLFEPEPTIFVLNVPIVAEAYRFQFQTIWDHAIVIPQKLIDDWRIPEKYTKEYFEAI